MARWFELPLQLPSGKLLQNYGKSQFSMGKPTINGHFQWQTVSLPEGNPFSF